MDVSRGGSGEPSVALAAHGRLPNTPYSQARAAIAVALLLVVAQFVVTLLVLLTLAAIGGVLHRRVEARTLTTVLANLVTFWGVLWVAARRARLTIRDVLPLRRFAPVLLVPMAASVIGLHMLVSEADNFLERVLPAPAWMLHLFGGPNDLAKAWLPLVCVGIVAPITEEPLFRGLLLRGLLGRWGTWPALIWTAGLFALVHLNPWQATGAVVLGLLVGWWTVRTGSLLPALLGHALNNVLPDVTITWLHWDQIPGYAIPPGQPVVWQPWWFDTGAALLALVGVLGTRYLLTKLPHDSLTPLPHPQTVETGEVRDDSAQGEGAEAAPSPLPRSPLRRGLSAVWWSIGLVAYVLVTLLILVFVVALGSRQLGWLPTLILALALEVAVTLALVVSNTFAFAIRYVAPVLAVLAIVFFTLFTPSSTRRDSNRQATPSAATPNK